jgi:hypothetical protein
MLLGARCVQSKVFVDGVSGLRSGGMAEERVFYGSSTVGCRGRWEGLGKGLPRGQVAQQGRAKGRTAVTMTKFHERTQGRHLHRTTHVKRSDVQMYQCR